MTIHFDTNCQSPSGLAVCGLRVFTGHSTTDPDVVTCGNCKRTVSYRARKAET